MVHSSPRKLLLVLVLAALALPARAGDIRELRLKDWQPRSMLVVKQHRVDKPAFPVIDVHNHLGEAEDVAKVVKAMDAANVRTVVNLDGGSGAELRKELTRFEQAYPGRFLTFALVDFRGIDAPNWSARRAKQLEADFLAGAKGGIWRWLRRGAADARR